MQLFIKKCFSRTTQESHSKNHIYWLLKQWNYWNNEAKKQKGGFLGMLLGTLGASLLGNQLTGNGTMKAGEGTDRACQAS